MTDTLVLRPATRCAIRRAHWPTRWLRASTAATLNCSARYGAAGRTKSRQDAVCHFFHLADALDTNSPALFDDYIGRVKRCCCSISA